MYAYFFVLVFALMPVPGRSKQEWNVVRFNDEATTRTMGHRLVSLIKSTYHDVSDRIKDLNDIRFLYEKTPFYELGYVFSEIMERYKKMTMHYKRVSLTTIMTVYDAFTHVEHMQKLYFEIYHLNMMMHEIPRKYNHMPGFKNRKENDEERNRKAAEKKAFEKAAAKRQAKTALLLKLKKQAASTAGDASGHKGSSNGTDAPLKHPFSGPVLEIVGMQDKTRYIGTNPSEYKNLYKKLWPYDYGWEPANFKFD